MLAYLLWILFGGIVGWLSTLVRWARPTDRPTLNVTAGVVGAMVGGCAHGRVVSGGDSTSAATVLFVLLAAIMGVVVGHYAQRRVQA